MNQILSPSDFIVTFLILTMKFNCFKKFNIVKGVRTEQFDLLNAGWICQYPLVAANSLMKITKINDIARDYSNNQRKQMTVISSF